MGPRTLCNACGLVYAKLIKKRDRERGRSGSTKATQENGKKGNVRGSSTSRAATGTQGAGGGADDSLSVSGGESEEEDGEEDYGSGTSAGRRSDMDYRGGRE